MNESFINHLFLPHYLPSSADDDYLIGSNHENEYKLLEHVHEFLVDSFTVPNTTNTLPIFQNIIDCIERWSKLQNPQYFSVSNVQSTIETLPQESFLPIYFHTQNAAILIEIDQNQGDQPLISAWQVLLPSEETTSSLKFHLSCFPVTTYILNNRAQLTSKAHCELFVDLMHNVIEYNQSYKSTRQVNETRDVPKSHYVCQWWIQHFDNIQIETESTSSVQFTKKHRDHVRWNNCLLPFRRSGLWMTIKTVLHTILTKRLKHLGTLVYKLLITHFLTYTISKISSSTDILLHCCRKIVRRLRKIENILLFDDSNEMTEWITYTKQSIELKIDKIVSQLMRQHSINCDKESKNEISINDFTFDNNDIYQHSCEKFKPFIHGKRDEQSNHMSAVLINSTNNDNDLSTDSIPSLNYLTEKMNYTIGISLTRIELWVELHLKQWIDQHEHDFEILQSFYEEYQCEALNHYWSDDGPTDPMGYSRFILTSLTIIFYMHVKLCQDKRFKRLEKHSIHIPNLLELFEFLVVPTRDDIIRVRTLYNFFYEYNNKLYPDLLKDITSKDAFGVDFVAHSPSMQNALQNIHAQAQQDKENKIEEINDARQKYESLMNFVKNLSCKETNGKCNRNDCQRCATLTEAKNIQVKIFECPIPTAFHHAMAVIFELQMPIEIRCYRDILWQFINRSKPYFEQQQYEMYYWLNVPPHRHKLTPFYTGPSQCRVELVSSKKSVTQTHYSKPPFITSSRIEDFIFENSLEVKISPTKPMDLEDERYILTPQLDHPNYKPLQFTIGTTNFLQNHVISNLFECTPRMTHKQFIEFGSFRSGHRLQWWNLLTVLEMNSLPLAEESVAILITHSILQYGPVISEFEFLSSSWCPESHLQLVDNVFIDELILRLHRKLDDCVSNWQNELVLLVITMITMRLFTLCNSTRIEQVINLVLKCRQLGERWIDLMSKSIQTIPSSTLNEVKKLRTKTMHIAIACVLTFSTHNDRIHHLLSSDEHIVSLLKAIMTINDIRVINNNHSNMSIFMKNIMRFSERTLTIIQPIVAEYLQKTSYQSLNTFVFNYWIVAKRNGSMNGQWKKRINDLYDGWYDCQYESNRISIDCIQGVFLINGMTTGYLPSSITSHQQFIRIFGNHMFEVQLADKPMTYITKHTYHICTQPVHYEFYFNNEKNILIIRERHVQTNDLYHLIPNYHFKMDLPDMFVSNYSHWCNYRTEIIEFRPIQFNANDFLTNIPFQLFMRTGYLHTTDKNYQQTLINRLSPIFQVLFKRYFIRLDDEPYVYMMENRVSQTNRTIHIYLSRLGIAFLYNTSTNIITSREYPNMYIDKYQSFGTLLGLTSGLLLSPLSTPNHNQIQKYPYRKLIIPYGKVCGKLMPNADHQTITIHRSSTVFAHQYFVFTLHDRLRIVQATDCPTGWLYLALLHALTSHSLPDQYTGMTGMDRAFQLLNSASCWSDEPYDSFCLDILTQIASISPQVTYYPDHLTCMEQISWNANGLPCSLQHFGYYLIVKYLIGNSLKLNFIYSRLPSIYLSNIFYNNKVYNEFLLKKLYWNYQDSYNSLARLPSDIENDIRSTSKYESFKICPKDHSSIFQYKPGALIENLSKQKQSMLLKDCSQHNWLPLSQWVNTDTHLNEIWISILKRIRDIRTSQIDNIENEIEQIEILIDFVHYLNDKDHFESYYFYVLKRALLTVKMNFLQPISFPSFQTIPETLIKQSKHRRHTNQKTNTNVNGCLTYSITNKVFHSFLKTVEDLIWCTDSVMFPAKVSYKPQQFRIELFTDHFRLEQYHSTQNSIDRNLLKKARQKFRHRYTDYFKKSFISIENNISQNQFPYEIFSSSDKHENDLPQITDYFQNRLEKSWKKLFETEHKQYEHPTIQEITDYLQILQEESMESWNVLVSSIMESNEQLFNIGLFPSIAPSTLVSYFQEESPFVELDDEQSILFGSILVNWTLEQHLERALHCATQDQWEDFIQEISNKPHVNWAPPEYVSWLILELEMNITIRDIQIKVAHHMMQPIKQADDASVKSIVMQMNMGEGKTSVILPMLATGLASSDSCLVRIIVLKSLFQTNYQLLRYRLAGLLNRRVFPFVCHRDLNFNDEQIEQISDRLKQALLNCDVILTSPEDILSFDLLCIDKCRRKEFDVGKSMLIVQNWLKHCVRDILDECDEILHVKYQLIYTVGNQQQIDGGSQRWQMIQFVLQLLKKYAAKLATRFKGDVYYQQATRKSSFPGIRFQSNKPYSFLCKQIANDWLNKRSYRQIERQKVLSFILNSKTSSDDVVKYLPGYDFKLLLILRGLLSSEVLLVALKKRYRVNYGININSLFKRLSAVPFRAKDVAADRTEFGHPDLVLLLTQLSYYYSGLNDFQLIQCFNNLYEKETDPTSIYDHWISIEDDEHIPTNIKHWKNINFNDYQQRINDLFPTFRHNMLVIDYFCNNFIFPYEIKQFPHKLIASSWDLSSSLRSHIITGFSGTSDTKLLLPSHIRQCDLTELRKTDALVVHNLFRTENENYEYLPMHSTSNEILEKITNYKEMINVILDVGALFIDGNNRDIARKWLNLSNKNLIDYVVYFDYDVSVVCDRQYQQYTFKTSPACERLDRCIFYLDEIHTRGTDFKFPKGFRAAVTLGNHLPKDRFVQACMRMRKLGHGHSLTFWSSYEVHQQISIVKQTKNIEITIIDILHWLNENSKNLIWDGLYHWAIQSLNYQRKLNAFQRIHWKSSKQILTDKLMTQLSDKCMEPEIIDLNSMYGSLQKSKTIDKIYSNRCEQSNYDLSKEIHEFVSKRLSKYGGTKQRLSYLFNEEQQHELEREQELEQERNIQRFQSVKPYESKLHGEIKNLCQIGSNKRLSNLSGVFKPLTYAFSDTTFVEECCPESWLGNIWVSTEFQRVIKTPEVSLNQFLRPPRWIIVYQNQHIIFINPLEANWLMGCLNSFHFQNKSNNLPIITLRLLLPRTNPIQSIFINTPALMIPRISTTAFQIPIEWLIQLFVFNGTLYFETTNEQTAYCQWLGLYPRPRTKSEEKAFENSSIDNDKSINNSNSLLHFTKQLLENRNNSHLTVVSHVGSIILDSFKLLS